MPKMIVSFPQGITVGELRGILGSFRDQGLEVHTSVKRGKVLFELEGPDENFLRLDGDFGFCMTSEDWQEPYREFGV